MLAKKGERFESRVRLTCPILLDSPSKYAKATILASWVKHHI
jgi:hypothetical protein